MAQNLALIATSIGLGSCQIGAFLMMKKIKSLK
ncbi:hypothetical protein JJE00_05285 [Candidatus Bathyarchaeota archaeon]|nr:hypothetical protein [Candidatus Bathyarchaeota archaeon]